MASQNEVDDMIKRIQASKGVQGKGFVPLERETFVDDKKIVSGLIIIDSEGIPIRTSMDNETTLHYAALISQLIIHAKRVVRELDPSQELEQLRLRSHKHEIIVAPESKYIMIVVQVPDAFWSNCVSVRERERESVCGFIDEIYVNI